MRWSSKVEMCGSGSGAQRSPFQLSEKASQLCAQSVDAVGFLDAERPEPCNMEVATKETGCNDDSLREVGGFFEV